MSARCLIYLAFAISFNIISPDASGESTGPMPATNRAPDNGTAQAQLQKEAQDEKDQRAAAQAEDLKLLNETWPKDEPRIFEWNADQCREELVKYKDRESNAKKAYVELYSDPVLKGLQDEIDKLSKTLDEKRKEYARVTMARKTGVSETEERTRKRDALTKELKFSSSVRFRIEARLARLAAMSADATSTNAATSVPQKAGAAQK